MNRLPPKGYILLTFVFFCFIFLFSLLAAPNATIDKIFGALSKIEFILLAKISPWISQGPEPQGPQIIVVSHRGLIKDSTLENSIQSIEAAIRSGFQGLEVDISFSSDYRPYLFHGPGLELLGKKGNFSDLTASEIEDLRLFNGQPILSLSQFCRLYVSSFDKIYLDIKGANFHHSKKAENLIRAIGVNGHERIILIGVPWRVIKSVKTASSSIKVGFEQKGAIANFLLGADTVSLYYKYEFSLAEYKLAKFLGLEVVIWTVNDLDLLNEIAQKYRLTVLTDLNLKETYF